VSLLSIIDLDGLLHDTKRVLSQFHTIFYTLIA
jgi:hypothetical protein